MKVLCLCFAMPTKHTLTHMHPHHTYLRMCIHTYIFMYIIAHTDLCDATASIFTFALVRVFSDLLQSRLPTTNLANNNSFGERWCGLFSIGCLVNLWRRIPALSFPSLSALITGSTKFNTYPPVRHGLLTFVHLDLAAYTPKETEKNRNN